MTTAYTMPGIHRSRTAFREASALLLFAAFLAGAAITATASESPTRQKTAGGVPLYWTGTSMPVKVYFHEDGTDQIPGYLEFLAIKRAMYAWVEGSSRKIRWVFAGTTATNVLADDGENIVIFIDQPGFWTGDKSGKLAYTAVYYDDISGEIRGFDIAVNTSQYSFTINRPNDAPGDGGAKYDLKTVLTRQFGYAAGLSNPAVTDDSPQQSTMDATIAAGETFQQSLTYEDKVVLADATAQIDNDSFIYPFAFIKSLDTPDQPFGAPVTLTTDARRNTSEGVTLTLYSLASVTPPSRFEVNSIELSGSVIVTKDFTAPKVYTKYWTPYADSTYWIVAVAETGGMEIRDVSEAAVAFSSAANNVSLKTTPCDGRKIVLDGTTFFYAPYRLGLDPSSSHTVKIDPLTEDDYIEDGVRWTFSYWEGGAPTGTQGEAEFTADEDKTLTAHFNAQYRLLLSTTPAGGGTTSLTPGEYWFPLNLSITVSAAPEPGYRFVAWNVNGSDITDMPLVLNMTEAKTVAAMFELIPRYTLTLSLTPSGLATLSRTPDQADYLDGSAVTVSVTDIASGYYFSQWTGGVDDPFAPATTVTMDSDKNVTAALLPYPTLSLSVSPAGAGVVTADPAKPFYDLGETVSLTAAAASEQWWFYSWEGDVAEPSSPLTEITMNEDKSARAVFREASIELSSPPDSSAYTVGEVIPIRWTTTGVIPLVNVMASTDGGATWGEVYASLPNMDSVDWLAPPEYAGSPNGVLLKVQSVTLPTTLYDTMNSPLSISNTGQAELNLLAPTAGETLTAGEFYGVRWEYRGSGAGTTLRIDYSPDEGSTWLGIAADADINDGAFIWSVPQDDGGSYLIRLLSNENPDLSASNISPFFVNNPDDADLTTDLMQLYFTGYLGTTSVPSQVLKVCNPGSGGSVAWRVESTSSPSEFNIELSPTSGVAWKLYPSHLSVRLVNLTETPGVFDGSLRLVNEDNPADFVTVAVRLSMTRPGLESSETSFVFEYENGGNSPASQALTLTTPDKAAVEWSLAETDTGSPAWLGLSWTYAALNGPDSSATVTLSASPSALGQLTAAGEYSASFTVVNLSGTAGDRQGITAALNFYAGDMNVSPSELYFTYYRALGTDPAPQQVTITNSGRGRLDFTLSVTSPGDGGFLELPAPPDNSGTIVAGGNSSVTISATPGDLAAGSYEAAFKIRNILDPSDSEVVTVHLNVLEGLPSVNGSPAEIEVRQVWPTGAALPEPSDVKTFVLTNNGQGRTTVTLQVIKGSPADPDGLFELSAYTVELAAGESVEVYVTGHAEKLGYSEAYMNPMRGGILSWTATDGGGSGSCQLLLLVTRVPISDDKPSDKKAECAINSVPLSGGGFGGGIIILAAFIAAAALLRRTRVIPRLS